MRKIVAAILVALMMLATLPGSASAASFGHISITLQPCQDGNVQIFAVNGTGFTPPGPYQIVFTPKGQTAIPFPVTPDSSGSFSHNFGAIGIQTYDVNVRSGTTVLSNTLRYTVCSGVVDLTPAVTPPNIVMSVDDSQCGQVTVTAHGFGLQSGTSYQMVAGGGYPMATKSMAAGSDNTIKITFTMAEAGEWGNATVRTSSGGYLATTNAWYHLKACQ
jgi:hypothetical protein